MDALEVCILEIFSARLVRKIGRDLGTAILAVEAGDQDKSRVRTDADCSKAVLHKILAPQAMLQISARQCVCGSQAKPHSSL